MSSPILDSLKDHKILQVPSGDLVITQGETTDRLYVLIEGQVEVIKDGVTVALASQPGVVFGEMSVLLGSPHTAAVRAVTPCSFHIIEDPRAFLHASPDMCLHLCGLLARRLDSLNRYLVDVKQQFEGHDHIGMVDEVLEALLHRQPRERVRPSDSTIHRGE